jgi:hypothetical protein
MSNFKKLFTIQDSNGRYVDKQSIWLEKETGEWHYTSKSGYKVDNSKRNLDTGVILCNSEKEAQGVIDWLQDNLHKVDKNLHYTFSIKEVM